MDDKDDDIDLFFPGIVDRGSVSSNDYPREEQAADQRVSLSRCKDKQKESLW